MERQPKHQSQQLMSQQHEQGLLSFVRNLVLNQSDGPIPILQNFYIIEKGIFENFFPVKSYQQTNDEAEFIKQLNEKEFAGPVTSYDGEKQHYVVSKRIFIDCQVAEPIHHGNNANNEIINHQRIKGLEEKCKGLEEKCKTLQFHNQKLESERQKSKGHNDNLMKEVLKYQPALDDAKSFNPEKMQHGNNSNYEIINHQRIKELEEKCKTLHFHNQKLESERQKLKDHNDNLMKEVLKYQPALDDAKSFNPEKMQHGNNANYEIINHQRIKELEERCKGLEKECKTLQFYNQKLESERQNLKDHNHNLKKEASEYQSALGDATSFHLGNQDSDTTSQLSKDIGNLHLSLEKFCGLKKGIEINDQKEIEELLKKFKCSIKGPIKENKILISGVLERHIIEIIIEKANEYFNHEENDKDNKEVDEQGDKRQQQNLEAKIVKTTIQLLKMIESFSAIRTGNDKICKSAPTKLRQQIFGILGNRGFSNTVLDESGGKEHPFVEKLRKEILDLMNRYRKIRDQEKLAEHEKIINDIIKQVVNIFFFRLKVQEPTAECKWFLKNTKINTLTMNGPWDKDELEYLSVDICAFPLIGSNLDNAEDAKMMFPAQIVANYP